MIGAALPDAGLALVRLGVGGIAMAHGLQKMGYLGGRGMAGTVGMLEGGLGIRPARFWAPVLILAEVVGGAMVLVGFLGPIAPLVIVADMAVAIVTVHWSKGFWNANGGIEFALLVGLGAAALALTGFGAWSIDAAIGLTLPAWVLPIWAVAQAVGVGAALASRSLRKPVASA